MLVQLATEVGLDGTAARAALIENLFESEVFRDQEEAQQIGVQGVPFFVFNRKYAVSGAQSPETFAQVLNKVWEEEQPGLIIENSGASCDINGNC